MKKWVWHKGIGKGKKDENINLCGLKGAAFFGFDKKGVTCKRCRRMLRLEKIATQENKSAV